MSATQASIRDIASHLDVTSDGLNAIGSWVYKTDKTAYGILFIFYCIWTVIMCRIWINVHMKSRATYICVILLCYE